MDIDINEEMASAPAGSVGSDQLGVDGGGRRDQAGGDG